LQIGVDIRQTLVLAHVCAHLFRRVFAHPLHSLLHGPHETGGRYPG
jgi:hypothetical protein